ncbi:MAG: hypothetical protein ACXW3D_03370 [Caulobacteraceae bacterium]
MTKKPNIARKRPVSPEAYSEVVDSARMRNIRLIKSDFLMDPEGMYPGSEWKSGFGCDVTETTFDLERGLLTGMIVGEAFCKIGRRKVVSLRCHYLVAYDISGTPDEAAALSFVARVGNFAAYPYFRAHFAELTTQAGLMLPPLPILKEGRYRITPTASAGAKPAQPTKSGSAVKRPLRIKRPAK